MARDIPQPTSFRLICHRCERSLMVSVTEADILSVAVDRTAARAGLWRKVRGTR
jgi:hypothetical protein